MDAYDLKNKVRTIIKYLFKQILPAYRVSLRIERKLVALEYQLKLMNKRQEMMFWYSLRNPGQDIKEVQKAFFKDVPKATESLRSMQLKLVELFANFDKICKENNIEYWIDAGTLVGTIRHKGFIPWDDDIDVSMTRKNFDKLFKVVNKGNSDFSIAYYCGWEGEAFSKFISKKNTFFFVDICIYDEVNCSNWEEALALWRTREELQLSYRKAIINMLNFNVTESEVARWSLDPDMNNKIMHHACSYSEQLGCKDGGNFLFVSLEYPRGLCQWPRIYERNTILPLRSAEFEGISVFVPNEYNKYLEDIYGNIWSLPDDFGMQRHFTIKEFRKTLRS